MGRDPRLVPLWGDRIATRHLHHAPQRLLLIGCPWRSAPAIQAHKPIAELSVDLSAGFAVVQHRHHVAAGKEVLSKRPGLFCTLCVYQRSDDLVLRDLNGQVEQLAQGFLPYNLV